MSEHSNLSQRNWALYEPSLIEPKWQAYWEKEELFKAQFPSQKPKRYILDMFPYPSSEGLHVGHPEGYTATDILSRYYRACGFNVLHPMGWDAFGLPAEQYAIKTGTHPAERTQSCIQNFKAQLKRLGLSFDWSRELSTADPSYYRWTQYLFLELKKKGLAYQKEEPVNWCPILGTVLANEEVINGVSERGGHPVVRVPMRQWMLKVTSYAERLLEGLDALDWPEGLKELQRNWIGKSEGLEIEFVLENSKRLKVFTTRPETLFGSVALVLSPEHPWVHQQIEALGDQGKEIDDYVTQAQRKSEIDRGKADKSGVFAKAFVSHPLLPKKLPIWISDYVLGHYGTGAIMAVPAHDERDFEFAQFAKLKFCAVIGSPGSSELCYTGEGVMENSGSYTGLSSQVAKDRLMEWSEKEGFGERKVRYRLRDWLFSRQRYWGEPIPVAYHNGEVMDLGPEDLPLTLPEVKSFAPDGSPLASVESWSTFQNASGQLCERESDTMPGSAGSAWYFLRFCDPHNNERPFSKDALDYWMPVDCYIGGAEHAVGHLLYSRFWTKVFYDAGLVPVDEPFKKLVNQGMILGEDGEKMSKSRGNVINPDSVIELYGADTLRLYEMFMGPLEKEKPWSTKAIEGVFRFLSRSYRLFFGPEGAKTLDPNPASLQDKKVLHQSIKKVTKDIQELSFNTAISQMMIFVNHFTKAKAAPLECMEIFVQLLHPFAPHLAEELWFSLGHSKSVSLAPWPAYDPKFAVSDEVRLAVQVNGKTRCVLTVDPGAKQDVLEAQARMQGTVIEALKAGPLKKVIYVPGRILNFVLM